MQAAAQPRTAIAAAAPGAAAAVAIPSHRHRRGTHLSLSLSPAFHPRHLRSCPSCARRPSCKSSAPQPPPDRGWTGWTGVCYRSQGHHRWVGLSFVWVASETRRVFDEGSHTAYNLQVAMSQGRFARRPTGSCVPPRSLARCTLLNGVSLHKPTSHMCWFQRT